MNDELPFWIALTKVPSVGRVRIGTLEQRFGTLESAWGADEEELRNAGLAATSIRNASSIAFSRRGFGR
jgi:predicted Rossmann fold nucleotide-binding protein DprA/Smf involved in DNA uptake